MLKALHAAAAIVCMLCVLAICIAPLADLPHTTNRAYQLAMLLLAILFAGAFVCGVELQDREPSSGWEHATVGLRGCIRMPPLLIGCVLKC